MRNAMLAGLVMLLALAQPAAAAVSIEVRHPGTLHRFPGGDAVAARYRVTVGFDAFEVHLPAAVAAALAQPLMARVAELLEVLPPENRPALQQVEFDPRPWRGGGYYPGFVAAATGGNHNMTFYRNGGAVDRFPGGWSLDERTFAHEMGHVVAMARFGAYSPDRWEHAALRDGNLVSDYAKLALTTSNGYQEDFGDAYAMYVTARRRGGAELAAFRKRFPSRTELLETLCSQRAF